jgi:zinc/manganese transport system substrate-binding protein
MSKRLQALAVLLLVTAGAVTVQAASKLNVITTTEDLSAIAREIGGDLIAVDSIARGYQDPHFVEPKPSFLLKLQKADLLAVVGLQLEIGWLPPLITRAATPEFRWSGRVRLTCRSTARFWDFRRGQVTRAMGDVHPLGNPHTGSIPTTAASSARRWPTNSAPCSPPMPPFRATLSRIRQAPTESVRVGKQKWRISGGAGDPYHRSWPRFCERFGLVVVD